VSPAITGTSVASLRCVADESAVRDAGVVFSVTGPGTGAACVTGGGTEVESALLDGMGSEGVDSEESVRRELASFDFVDAGGGCAMGIVVAGNGVVTIVVASRVAGVAADAVSTGDDGAVVCRCSGTCAGVEVGRGAGVDRLLWFSTAAAFRVGSFGAGSGEAAMFSLGVASDLAGATALLSRGIISDLTAGVLFATRPFAWGAGSTSEGGPVVDLT